MTQKERLVELILNSGVIEQFFDYEEQEAERLADYLLQNGVIVPPCKVGTILYNVADKVEEIHVFGFDFDKDDSYLMVEHWYENINELMFHNDYWLINFNEFGKTVFPTRKAAEQALKEIETDGRQTNNS